MQVSAAARPELPCLRSPTTWTSLPNRSPLPDRQARPIPSPEWTCSSFATTPSWISRFPVAVVREAADRAERVVVAVLEAEEALGEAEAALGVEAAVSGAEGAAAAVVGGAGGGGGGFWGWGGGLGGGGGGAGRSWRGWRVWRRWFRQFPWV